MHICIYVKDARVNKKSEKITNRDELICFSSEF